MIICISVYKIYTKYYPIVGLPTDIKITKNGADIKIEKFKVIHEVSGHKDWELKADHAEVNSGKNLTMLKNVQLEYQRKKNQTYWISADSGTLKNDTKEFELEGRVRLIAESDSFIRQVHKKGAHPKVKATRSDKAK